MAFDDVRMRGFRRRASVDEVLAWIDALPVPRRTERAGLFDAPGRVLAADVVSAVDVPAFRRAAMDGYAVRGRETYGATDAEPLPLRLVGDVRPGTLPELRIGPGEAARIRTGAPLPEGADAVLPAEQALERGETVLATGEVPPERHVGAVGEDVRSGTTVRTAGGILRPQDVALLSSLGIAEVEVLVRPRILVVTTGEEILPAGAAPTGARIPDANGPLLVALAAADGGAPRLLGPLPDDDPRLARAIATDEADLVVVAGSSSVGPDDVAPSLAAAHGRLVFHGVAMRPASPTGFAEVGGRPVALLPGHPASALCAWDLLVGRLVRRLAGRDPEDSRPVVRVPLARKAVSELGRTDHLRVRLEDGRAVPITSSGAGILSSTVRADGFVVVPAASEGYPEGTVVSVRRYGA